jgi:transcription initiation factor TFIIIB Brf1 subunit/transcription initiation factor TFIIB
MPESATCRHEHTQLIAKDNEAEYIECLDCGAILETGEIPAALTPAGEESRAPGPSDAGSEGSATAASEAIDESLSDA